MPDHYLVPDAVLKVFPSFGEWAARVDARLLAGGFRLLAWLAPRNAYRLARGLFGFFGPLSSKSEKVRRNLRIVFPDSSQEQIQHLTKATFQHLAMAAVELAQAKRVIKDMENRVEIAIEDDRIVLPSAGSPAVMVTAHVGPWQYGSILSQLLGIRMTLLYAPEYNPHARALFLPLRQALGSEFLSRDNSIRPLMKELAQGHCIGFASDTRFDQGSMVPLFGHDAPTNTAAARLALRFNVPLIAVRCDRLPQERYRITFARLIPPDDSCDDPDEQALLMTTRLNEEFERWIRRYPGQWLCMKRRWPRDVDASVASKQDSRANAD